MSYEEEDTCHMKWRIYVMDVAVGVWGLTGHQCAVSVEEDTCHMRRRVHVANIQYSKSTECKYSGGLGFRV